MCPFCIGAAAWAAAGIVSAGGLGVLAGVRGFAGSGIRGPARSDENGVESPRRTDPNAGRETPS